MTETPSADDSPNPPTVPADEPSQAQPEIQSDVLTSEETVERDSERSVSASDLRAAIDRIAAALGGRIEALQVQFEREIRAEATREKVVDRLHAELQEYKRDLLLSMLRPIFLDLIQLHDDIGKTIEALATGPENAPARSWPEVLDGIRQGIEDILYRQGVEPFSGEGDSETFDPKRQRAVSAIPTEDATRDRFVAIRHRKGFVSGERIIRPEIVSVYTFKPGGRSSASGLG